MTLSLLFLLGALEAVAAKPYYTCTSGKARYELELERTHKVLAILAPSVTQRIVLTAPDTVIPRRDTSGPQYYFRRVKAGKTAYTTYDFGTYVRIHYAQKGGGTEVSVGIFQDYKPVPSLRCKTSRFKARVVPLSDSLSKVDRHSELLRMAADHRTREGELFPEGILAVESSIRSFFYSQPSGKEKKRFIEAVSSDLSRISRPSINILDRRFTGKVTPFWKEVLKGSRYRYYPQVQRYVDWVQYGFKNPPPKQKVDWDSVYAGVSNFGRSGIFEVKDFREFFQQGVSEYWDGIEIDRMVRLLGEVPRNRRVWFVSMWNDRQKRRDYRDIEAAFEYYLPKMIQSLTAAPKKGEKERTWFGDFRGMYSYFMYKGPHDKPRVRQAVARRLAPHLKALSPNELRTLDKEFIRGDRSFFEEMMKIMKSGDY